MRLLTAALVFALGSPALAQTGIARLGDRVSIEAPKAGYNRLVGEVTATTPDVISVKAEGYVDEVAVRRVDIMKIRRSLSSRRNTARGAAFGGTLGLFGALWFAQSPPVPGASTADAKSSFSGRNAAIGGIIGAGLGAFIGSFVRSDTWLPISAMPGSGAGSAPVLGFSVRF